MTSFAISLRRCGYAVYLFSLTAAPALPKEQASSARRSIFGEKSGERAVSRFCNL
jgi:hypothetical protein